MRKKKRTIFRVRKESRLFEKIYKKDSLADGFDKYINFEKLRRSPNSTMQDIIPEWNTAYKKLVNIGCSLSY